MKKQTKRELYQTLSDKNPEEGEQHSVQLEIIHTNKGTMERMVKGRHGHRTEVRREGGVYRRKVDIYTAWGTYTQLWKYIINSLCTRCDLYFGKYNLG